MQLAKSFFIGRDLNFELVSYKFPLNSDMQGDTF